MIAGGMTLAEARAFTTGRPIEFAGDTAVLSLPTCELWATLAAAGEVAS